MVNCWAMRTSRESEEHREFVNEELDNGRLRQGWGWNPSQDLHRLQDLWHKREELTKDQQKAARHWRMGNWRKGVGQEIEEDYMKIDDLVVAPNMPDDGLFTICRIVGPYSFELSEEHEDFGHTRPVDVLTRGGVSNGHELVHAGLRRSFRCRARLWNVRRFEESLNEIVKKCVGGNAPHELRHGWTPQNLVEITLPRLFRKELASLADQLETELSKHVRGEEWEPVLQLALEHMFPVSVEHTGGPQEHGADLEIKIRNPFEQNADWIVPVQVKDYENQVDANVVAKLEEAFESRSRVGQVIAVVLLVSNAEKSVELEMRMGELSKKHGVPFVFCGRDRFRRLLTQGLLRRPMDLDVN